MRIFSRPATLVGSLAAVIVVGIVLVDRPAATEKPIDVVRRAIIGNYIEDLTFIDSPPYRNYIAGSTSYGIWGAPITGNAPPRKLVDLRAVASSLNTGLPRGVTFIESEGRLAMTFGGACAAVHIVDQHGALVESRAIQYPTGYTPAHCEGLAYIPATSPTHPDRLLLALSDQPDEDTGEQFSRIAVLGRDGAWIEEITIDDPLNCELFGGLAFSAPDTMLVGCNLSGTSAGDATIRRIDFSGQELDRTAIPGLGFIEGVTQVSADRIAVTHNAEIFMFDAALDRLAGEDRSFQLGFGYFNPTGIAWNPDAGSFLVNATNGHLSATFVNERDVIVLPPKLDSLAVAVDLDTANVPFGRALAYLADEQRLAVGNIAPRLQRGVVLFNDDGTEAPPRVFLEYYPPPAPAFPSHLPIPDRLEYVSPTQQLFIRVRHRPGRVQVFTRLGAFVREFDPRPAGATHSVGSFAYFTEPDGDERLLFLMGAVGRVTDLYGVPDPAYPEFEYRSTLDIMVPVELAAITSGPDAGAFATVDPDNGEVVVFRFRK